MRRNNPFMSQDDDTTEFKKVFIIERRNEDGSKNKDSVWLANEFSEIQKIVAGFLDKKEEEISIEFDMLATHYDECPNFLADVIVKIADAVTERTDLDNQGFPRTRLNSAMISVDIWRIDDHLKKPLLHLLIK